jgi:hypothetical protein
MSCQFFAQDFRQVIAKPHCAQILLGNWLLLPLKESLGMTEDNQA